MTIKACQQGCGGVASVCWDCFGEAADDDGVPAVTQLRFTIPGPPVPKLRARHGRGRQTYTPEKTASYEQKVRLCGMIAANKAKWTIDPAKRYFVECDVFRQHKRGDFDNFLKSILDGLNGVAWKDDRQVLGGFVRVFDGFVPPRCEVYVREINMALWKP